MLMEVSVETSLSQRLRAEFDPWINLRSATPPLVLVVGAGMSYKLAPAAMALAAEVLEHRESIESELGVQSTTAPIGANDFYKWAAECLDQLIVGGKSLLDANRALARAIKVMGNSRFLATASIPLRGTTPRHRVIARLAREGRIRSIWSFNWDCWIESALEAVGLNRTPRTGDKIAPKDWKMGYSVWVDNYRDIDRVDVFPIFKAHGCVRALSEGESSFVIRYDDMSLSLAMQPGDRAERMRVELSKNSVVTLGWSGTEPYVQELFTELAASNTLGPAITIVDVDPKQAGHRLVTALYGRTPDASGVQVAYNSPGVTDDLLTWVQTLRGLSALSLARAQNAGPQVAIEEISNKLPCFNDAKFLSHWATTFIDSWLPIWMRMCFFVKAQDFQVAPSDRFVVLPSEIRDAHIPWHLDGILRNDLNAAARLAIKLDESSAIVERWDLDSYPGALWDRRIQLLVLPIPMWTLSEDISASYLKALFDSYHWSDKSRIALLEIMPLECASHAPQIGGARDALLNQWKEAVARVFNHRYLARSANIGVRELADLIR